MPSHSVPNKARDALCRRLAGVKNKSKAVRIMYLCSTSRMEAVMVDKSVGELLESWGVGHLLNVFEGMYQLKS